MKTFEAGERVTINSPGHRQDGKTGHVTEFGSFMGTWSVEFDGDEYGFFASELVKQPA